MYSWALWLPLENLVARGITILYYLDPQRSRKSETDHLLGGKKLLGQYDVATL